jgi:hypothetical protein
MAIEITTPVGRLVGGHPMVKHAVIDDKTKQPKLQADGVTPQTSTNIGLAIPKGSEQHWNQTEWGLKIWQQAAADWPRGEYNAPTFAWKVLDGDSQVPNKRGNKPCERQGFPGHWVLWAGTQLAVKCYHAGRYDPTQQIQNDKEIKPGDYCRLLLQVKGNGPSESPGMYLNPSLFELTRAGVEIVLDTGPSASDAFGGSAPQLPPGAQIDAAVAAPTPTSAPAAPAPQPAAAPPVQQAVAPAPDFLNPPGAAPAAPAAPEPVRYLLNGQVYTEAQLLAAPGWTAEHIAALPRA